MTRLSPSGTKQIGCDSIWAVVSSMGNRPKIEFSDPTSEEQGGRLHRTCLFEDHLLNLEEMLWLSSIESTSALGDSAEFGP